MSPDGRPHFQEQLRELEEAALGGLDIVLGQIDRTIEALDPISTLAIEDLISELKDNYTIVIVTHNMQQAARVSETTAFFNLAGVGKPGHLIEYGATSKIFSNPENDSTEAYISGRFG